MWMDKMNEAMMYIEDNLTGDIDLEKIAQITCHYPSIFAEEG